MIPVLLLLSRVLTPVSADPPAPPVNVELQAGLLSWAPGAEQRGVTFTVQSRPFNGDSWLDVSSCVRTESTFCDVRHVLQGAKYGCVRLQVRAQRGGPRSEASEATEAAEASEAAEAVEACSREGNCTPQVLLSSRPGSLTVHLSRAHALVEDFADHAEHRVCLRRSGRPQQQCRTSLSSLTFSDLDPGQTYCASVQFVQFSRPEGPPSCPVCRAVARSGHVGLVLGLVLGPVLVLGLVCAAYVLIFHREKLKLWLKPPDAPHSLRLPAEGALVLPPSEEHCSIIEGFTELNQDWTGSEPGPDRV